MIIYFNINDKITTAQNQMQAKTAQDLYTLCTHKY